jgi:hypothetical protein
VTLITKPFSRKSFDVDAVQITKENMEEVARWCHGTVVNPDVGRSYVSLKAGRGYEGDWACSKKGNFRLYNRRAFDENFTPTLVEGVREDNHPALFEDSVGSVQL